MRRLGVALPGLSRETIERRPYPPGQHPTRFRRRISDYAIRLTEKQKLRFHYGLTEVQLRNAMRKASRMPGPPGHNLAELLELRLDNSVFRLGFAPTIPAARQLVRHGQILVNGNKTTIPSYHLEKGDEVRVSGLNSNHPLILESIQRNPGLVLPSYLIKAQDGLSGKCVSKPVLNDIPIEFEERLVTEFYAAR